MKRAAYIVCSLAFFSCSVMSQSKPDLIIFDEDDPIGIGFYDASWGNVTSPSTLTLAGGSSDKMKIETVQHQSGTQCGLLEWKSVTGGDWKLFVSSPNWAGQNTSGYDSLVLYLNAPVQIAATSLPTLGLESTTGKLSSLVALGDFLPSGVDGDVATWQRVTIPLTAFQPYNQFDPALFKDLNFHQNVADNAAHTMWLDNIRIVSKASVVVDSTGPFVPKKITARVGDRTMTLHWDRPVDQSAAGYNVYKSITRSGSYAKANTSLLPTQSFSDVMVVNGQTYYYTVTTVNSLPKESGGSDTVAVTPKAFVSDDAFLEYLQQTAFDYFWYEANPSTGLIKDRSTKDSPASIAAVGFGLTAIGIGIDHGYITRAEGRDRTATTFRTFWEKQQGAAPIGTIGYKGWFYHFLNMTTGTREWTSELSSIDTGLLLAGMLYAKQYFNGTDSTETTIRALADSILNRMDWNWMCNSGLSLTMGWNPESGFISNRWIGYNEAMILYTIGLGAQNNHLSAAAWSAWTSGYQWAYGGWSPTQFVNFAPLFGHQYSHSWIDYRNIADDYMKGKGITYFENSRRATIAQRLYCIQNPKGFVGYGANMWGITASDVPTGYNARGTNMNDDGTLNATAPGGSMPFAPEYCLPALRNMYETHRTRIWTGYGFTDAFNETVNWWGPDVLGIDQGPIILMAENYRTGNVWKTFMKEKIIVDGLQRAGFTTVTDVRSTSHIFPSQFELSQNYPNPFNPSTSISYSITGTAPTTLRILNTLGQEVALLVNGVKEAGTYRAAFDASHLSSGVYLAVLKSGSQTAVKKMMLLR
ncbi:MAG: T9SS type A sorting domain-containing protein [Ignavibacteriales bacterium]|nr:T9SS type A sorting domain-containing protein [Ignavibacteriales bacterium]